MNVFWKYRGHSQRYILSNQRKHDTKTTKDDLKINKIRGKHTYTTLDKNLVVCSICLRMGKRTPIPNQFKIGVDSKSDIERCGVSESQNCIHKLIDVMPHRTDNPIDQKKTSMYT